VTSRLFQAFSLLSVLLIKVTSAVP